MSDDVCMPLLRLALAEAARPLLWIADEHIDAPDQVLPADRTGITALGNRIDTVAALSARGLPASFSDFDTTGLPRPAAIVYRISKEKAVVHHLINRAASLLPEGGQLWLIGGKQEGIKTYVDKAVKAIGAISLHENGHQSTRVVCLTRTSHACAPLDDHDYPQIRDIFTDGELRFFSKPGQYGWNKRDVGSQMLVNTFAQEITGGDLLDIGCGYGFLAVHASRYTRGRLVATDNNAAALASCRYAFDHNGIANAEVIAADCAQGITGRFDVVICNPPFHQGFSTRNDLTERFVTAAHARLSPEGKALFVVNQFIPLEARAAPLFGVVECIAREHGFKVLRLARPR